MNSSAICFLFFTLFLVLITHAPLHAEAKKGKRGKTLVAGLCGGIFLEGRADCMRAVGSDPNVLKAKNELQLTQAILLIAENKALEGKKFLKELAASNNSTAIGSCADNYDSIAVAFKNVHDTVSTKYSDLKQMIEDVSSATYDTATSLDQPRECDGVLESAHIVNPAIAALGSEMRLFCSIANTATNQYERFLMGI